MMIDIRNELNKNNIFLNLSRLSKLSLRFITNDKQDFEDLFASFQEFEHYKKREKFYKLLSKISDDKTLEPIEILMKTGKQGLAKIALSYELLLFYNRSDLLDKVLLKSLLARNLAIDLGLYNFDDIFFIATLSQLYSVFLKRNYIELYYKLKSSSTYDVYQNREWSIWGTTSAEISAIITCSLHLNDSFWKPIQYHSKIGVLDNLKQSNLKQVGQILYLANELSTFLLEKFPDQKINNWFDEAKELCNLDKCKLYNTISDSEKQYSELFSIFTSKQHCTLPLLEKMLFYENNLSINNTTSLLQKELATSQARGTKLALKLEETNRKLLAIALKDPLTGAYNRRFLTERLEEEIGKSKRYGTGLVLIMTDIDHFKLVNDTYGHDNGDVVLKEVVDLITKTKRKSDIFARIGGEEFLLVCETKPENGKHIAEKIRKAIEEKAMLLTDGTTIHITMSFGVASYGGKIKKIDDFFKLVDDRLYIAKESGRNRVIFE